jgi:hypothetical protein
MASPWQMFKITMKLDHKFKLIPILLLLILVFPSDSWAKFSLRRCMLLPISDSVGGAISFKVFEKVEKYIRESNWCYYRSNSEIINILGHYKNNLKSHLQNKEVLRIISDRAKSGSLIRINLVSQIGGMELDVQILGENGEDLYFKENTLVETDDIDILSRTLINWLEIYSKSIPYDGRVIGVLGDQFTIDVGREFGILPKNKMTVFRPLRKKRHPLLKEIVEWEKESIGDGELFHVKKSQSQGKINHYHSRKKLRIGDWVMFEKDGPNETSKEMPFKIDKAEDFGKLGNVGLFLNLGTGSATSQLSATDVRKIGGFLFGIDILGELWITREWWTSLEIGQRFSTYSKKEGNLNSANSNSVNNGSVKWKFGYKYLPIGFFFGPQIDGYLGYASFKYGLDSQTADGFVETSFKGLLIGTRGNMPIYNKVRAFLEFEFMLVSSYDEQSVVFGEDDSSSYYQIKVGSQYKYSPNISFEGSYGVTSNKASFETTNKQIKHKESVFRIGTLFTY